MKEMEEYRRHQRSLLGDVVIFVQFLPIFQQRRIHFDNSHENTATSSSVPPSVPRPLAAGGLLELISSRETCARLDRGRDEGGRSATAVRTDNVAAADGRRRLTRMPPAPCAATGGGGRYAAQRHT